MRAARRDPPFLPPQSLAQGAVPRYRRSDESVALDRRLGPGRSLQQSAHPRSQMSSGTSCTKTRPTLERSLTVFQFLDIMNKPPLVPRSLRPVLRLTVRAAVDVVPDHVAWSKLAGQISDRVPIRAPPAQASIRMGRDPMFLYRQASARHQKETAQPPPECFPEPPLSNPTQSSASCQNCVFTGELVCYQQAGASSSLFLSRPCFRDSLRNR